MAKLIWSPSEKRKQEANITKYISYINERYCQTIKSAEDLHTWSIEQIPDFWASIWDFTGIKASRGYDEVVDNLGNFPGAKWFQGARLNFAENLLKYRDNHLAFIFKGETQISSVMTYAELYDAVARLAKSLRGIGLKPGDRVAAYMPNLPETAIAMLAATSIGAVWASCAISTAWKCKDGSSPIK